MFKILLTAEYEKDFSKLSQQEQERVTKILEQLREQGSDVGKPLSGLSFFREKKFDGKRTVLFNLPRIFYYLGCSNQ